MKFDIYFYLKNLQSGTAPPTVKQNIEKKTLNFESNLTDYRIGFIKWNAIWDFLLLLYNLLVLLMQFN